MICVKPLVDGSLRIISLSSSQDCQFIELVEQSQINNPATQLTPDIVGYIFASAASLYGIVFIVKLILQQLGFRN